MKIDPKQMDDLNYTKVRLKRKMKNMENADENCLPCKITTVICLTAIGSYLIHQGRQQSKSSKYPLFLIGLGSIGLGIGEIFDKSPFRNEKEKSYSKSDSPT